ncbi:unnamed protein product [Rotaria socialis]|uniref:EF-hand domain-containing protein n=1 Tax=Rotaria socialis TaxID=392032 RepID=A0A817TCC4_9BILA|nr:unnamed protein product [Rotaria socialis]CAF3320650.1 unnamed protein product [Rotaria socialis]CAF3356664.1 unnamed protein product [Rotaria socialis]CAF3381316.1 unnamed protein product [Rotaria socialis]CAF3564790.1 unnamed protein product [Rotaria socialis]
MSSTKNIFDDLRSEFDRLDEDKDGYITLKEFRAFHSKTTNDASAIAKAFAAIDSDKDGLVTFEEFQRAYKD